jgi:hypothetical protein
VRFRRALKEKRSLFRPFEVPPPFRSTVGRKVHLNWPPTKDSPRHRPPARPKGPNCL